jgi:hypothetical protein
MAEAEREREQRLSETGRTGDTPATPRPPRDAGSRFGAFARARQTGNGPAAPGTRPPESEPPTAP